MKLLIAGSRSITDFDFTKYIPPETELIICGGAKGIDTAAENFADKKKISKLVLRPNYSLYGKAAPLKRNEVMVNLAERVLIIWDGKSKGTQYTIKYAEIMKKDITVINISDIS